MRLIAIDPEAALVERAAKEMDGRLVLGSIADVRAAAETLIARAATTKPRDGGWLTRSARRARQSPGRVGDHRVADAGPAASGRRSSARCALMSSAIPTRF